MKKGKLISVGVIIIVVAGGFYYLSVIKGKARREKLQKAVIISDYKGLKDAPKDTKLIVEGTISKKTKPIVEKFALACSENLRRKTTHTTSSQKKNRRSKTWKTGSRFVQSFFLVMKGDKKIKVNAGPAMKRACPNGNYHTEYQGRYKRYKGHLPGDQLSVLGVIDKNSKELAISGQSYYGGMAASMKESSVKGGLYMTIATIAAAVLGLVVIIVGFVKGE